MSRDLSGVRYAEKRKLPRRQAFGPRCTKWCGDAVPAQIDEPKAGRVGVRHRRWVVPFWQSPDALQSVWFSDAQAHRCLRNPA